MDLPAIIAQLRAHHEKLSQSIRTLELLGAEEGRRRGRPPKWLAAAKDSATPKRRGRPPGSKKSGNASKGGK